MEESWCFALHLLLLYGTWTGVNGAMKASDHMESSTGCHHSTDTRKCYYIVNAVRSHSEAEAECSRVEGGHLAAITDSSILSHVTYLLSSLHIESAWIGARYTMVRRDGQPSTKPSSANCGYLAISSSGRGHWFQTPCSVRKPFMCVYKRPPGSTVCHYEFKSCGQYCIRDMTIALQGTLVDWHHANQMCQEMHTSLPPVGSTTEVHDWMEQSHLCNVTSFKARVSQSTWTNYTNLRWGWTTGQPMNYASWLPNSPRPEVGRCVKMVVGGHLVENGFQMAPCSKPLPAVCEKVNSPAHSSYAALWRAHFHQRRSSSEDDHHHNDQRSTSTIRTTTTSTPSTTSTTTLPTTTTITTRRRRIRTPRTNTTHSTTITTSTPGERPRRVVADVHITTTPPIESVGHSRRRTRRPPDEDESGETSTVMTTGPQGRRSTSEAAAVTKPPPPLQWSDALIVGIVVGGVIILTVLLLIILLIYCLCRKWSKECSPKDTPLTETTRVNSSPGRIDNHGYDAVVQSDINPMNPLPPTYMALDNGGYIDMSTHQYERLQKGELDENHYSLIPYFEQSGTQPGPQPSGSKDAADQEEQVKPGPTPPPKRPHHRLPLLPRSGWQTPIENRSPTLNRSGEVSGAAGAGRRTAPGNSQEEYLEVIAPPNEQGKPRRLSDTSSKSRDSGIDLKN